MKKQKVQSEEKKAADGKKTKIKRVACFSAFFAGIIALCAAASAFLWAGGWMKKATCSIVLEDSEIWNQLECKDKEKKDGETSQSIDQGDNVIDFEVPEEITSTEELVTTIISNASKGVVTISVNTLGFDYEKGYIDEQSGIGSGFVVDSDGLIITNQHVVSERDAEYSVVLPGEEEAIAVEEVYRDNTNDIAILKVDKTGMPALKLGNSDELKRGNLAIAIGNPFGDLEGTATVGYVTGLDRDVSAGSGYFGSVTHYEGVIQTDAAINPGNSGGPLLNSSGEVIGINFATTQGADNISFAIPINRLKDRLEVFEQKGRFPQPYIGVSYSQRTIMLQDGIMTGAVVLRVEKNGPADDAGLKRGDIILSVGDKDLSQYSLGSIVQSAKVGEKLTLEVWREGETKNFEVVVGDKGE